MVRHFSARSAEEYSKPKTGRPLVCVCVCVRTNPVQPSSTARLYERGRTRGVRMLVTDALEISRQWDHSAARVEEMLLLQKSSGRDVEAARFLEEVGILYSPGTQPGRPGRTHGRRHPR